MKKLLIIPSVALALTLGLTGCVNATPAPDKGSSTSDTTENVKEEPTLTAEEAVSNVVVNWTEDFANNTDTKFLEILDQINTLAEENTSPDAEPWVTLEESLKNAEIVVDEKSVVINGDTASVTGTIDGTSARWELVLVDNNWKVSDLINSSQDPEISLVDTLEESIKQIAEATQG